MQKKYDFDTILDRSGSSSYKYDLMEKYFGTQDALALWVADMDFATPDFIMESIRKRCEHEVLGYTVVQDGWYSSIQNWLKKKHGWDVKREELGFVPGIVSGIAFFIQCFTNEGDKILIQTPVYPPFFNVPKKNNREVVVNQLVFNNGKLEIDFEDFEAKAASGCKAFILCSPHNPGGRVWTEEELSKMLQICSKYDLLVISDEIHADLALPGFKHHPAANLPLQSTPRIVTLMAASKSFNIPGLSSSFYIIRDERIRKEFIDFLDKAELSNGSLFAFIAPQAAYEKGEDWLRQLTEYLQDNVAYVDHFLQAHIPDIKASIPEASFLIWLDCRALNLDSKDLQNLFLKEAKLALNPGVSFGAGGEGFMRLNIGCPRVVLCEAMGRLKKAYESLNS